MSPRGKKAEDFVADFLVNCIRIFVCLLRFRAQVYFIVCKRMKQSFGVSLGGKCERNLSGLRMTFECLICM